MQPPSRSVGVRHFGQGFVDTLIVTLLASSQRASAARCAKVIEDIKTQNKIKQLDELTFGSTAYSQDPLLLSVPFSGRQSPKWYP